IIMIKVKITRPEQSQPAHAFWFDRKKYVTINFAVHKPKDVKVDIQPEKMILYCKNDEDDVIYNELHFYDKVQIHVSSLRKTKPDVAWPRLQKDPERPSWISVDFDNWRDWSMRKMKEKKSLTDTQITSNKGPAPDMDDLSDVSIRNFIFM
uniref:Si:ch211-131k2.3 n=1 Tax=Neogobius melanostomus TaxID=47308 RepID=A0A8C6TFA4_9GOBI